MSFDFDHLLNRQEVLADEKNEIPVLAVGKSKISYAEIFDSSTRSEIMYSIPLELAKGNLS